MALSTHLAMAARRQSSRRKGMFSAVCGSGRANPSGGDGIQANQGQLGAS